MSTDSSNSSPDPKIDSNISKMVDNSSERDFWDIDLGEEDIAIPSEGILRNPVQLPAQRNAVSNGKTTNPPEQSPHSTEPAELTELEPKFEEPAKPGKDQVTETAAETEDDIFKDLSTTEQEISAKESEEFENVAAEKVDQKPISIISTISSLSKIEKIAISALCVVLGFGAILTLIHFSNYVPTRTLVGDVINFPVSGKIVKITAASTYWRKPVRTGENADVVEWDTQLIPELKLSLSSKSGAIRVFFRNEEGVMVGDGITRTVEGNSEITVASTAGFENMGMHTAYRTGDSNRWVVQVFEAPDATSPREKLRQVLEMDIATQIR